MSTTNRFSWGLVFAAAAFAIAGCGESHVPLPDAPAPIDAPRGLCDSDRDCSALGLICDAAIGVCGECSRDSDCTGGAVCLVGTCSAPARCTTSRDCPGLVCDTARGRCVECAAAVDCDAPLVCRLDGRCARDAALPCLGAADCPGLVCDAASGSCVECVADADCPGERCDLAAHTCVECLAAADCTAPEVCDSATRMCVTGCTCTVGAECDDGVFCNGMETCGGCAMGCVAGAPVACAGGAVCDEAMGACGPPPCMTPGRYFLDADGDGYGVAEGWVLACTQPAGTAPASGDCDDADADRNPGETELCDTNDDDCDFTIDEGCSCAGVPDGSTRPCGLGVGACHVSTQQCSSGTWSLCRVPTPRSELCDGTDDDCDGAVDESPDADRACGVTGATCTSGMCSDEAVIGVAVAGPRSYAWTSAGRFFYWGGGPLAPTVLPGGMGVVAPTGIQGTSMPTCGVGADARLACWGQDFWGPSGSGIGPGMLDFNSIPGTEGTLDVSIGALVGCAVFGVGRVRCWGSGGRGHLGTGMLVDSREPVVVGGVDDAVAVASVSLATCALRRSGAVSCWGESVSGVLGNGTTGGAMASTPVSVLTIDDADDIAAGIGHFCARQRVSGEIWCWGENDFGILGDETMVDRSSPVRMRGIPAGSRLPRTLGGASTCVITPGAGRVLCIGLGTDGALGDDRGTNSMTPVEVLGLTGVIELAGHDQRWCALTATDVYCWGQGVLGDGASAMSFRPVRVVGLP